MPMTVSENSALHEHSALDLKTEPDEERRHRIEVRDGDADMVEASCVRHRVILQLLVLSIHSRDEADGAVSTSVTRISTRVAPS